MTKLLNQDECRTLEHCPACDKGKQQGLVVCWDCFKYGRQGQEPLKYTDKPWFVWLSQTRETLGLTPITL